MTAVAASPVFVPPRRFENGAEWLRALGDVPLKRVVFDPWPGTASEADLLRLVERDKRLCELIDGTLVEKSLGFWEARIAMRLGARLSVFVDENDLGAVSGADTTLRMSATDHVRLPDVAFISKARLPATWTAVPVVAPDLAVEVLSDGNTRAEMDQKLREYFDSGTRLAWYVDPRDRSVAVYRSAGVAPTVLREGETLEGGDVLPGFRLAVSDLFRDLPPAP